MKEIFFKGRKIFEFDDSNGIQVIGSNTYFITLIVDIYMKVFNGYRYSDIDIDAMNGYYPEVREDGEILTKKELSVIQISDLEDVINQLTLKKNSILMKNILSFGSEIDISNSIRKLEEILIELSILIDRLLESRLDLDKISIKGYVDNVNYNKIVDTFLNFNFSIGDSDDRIPSWLLDESQSIDLLINLLNLLIESGDTITVIVDRLDAKLEYDNYHKLINELYELCVKNSNFNIWLIPSTKEGVLLDYYLFKNTFIVNEEAFKLGDFDTTYESICRSYPDNNYPSKEEVLTALLQYYPFHNRNTVYTLNKELISMSVFMELLGENKDINILRDDLTTLEMNFLTNNNQ